MLPVFIKSRVQEPTYIFQHDCSWFNFLNKPDRLRKQVAFIIFSELFARNRKGWARNTASKQVYAPIWMPIKIVDIGTNDIPFRTVFFQNLAIVSFIFHKGDVGKARHSKAQSLSTRSGTNLNASQWLLHKVISPGNSVKRGNFGVIRVRHCQ